MKNFTLVFILVQAMISCSTIPNFELKNDPILLEVFNEEEVSSLELIVEFFDKSVMEKAKNPDTAQAYHEYFESIRYNESFEDFNKEFVNKDDSKELIERLCEKGIFSEIWTIEYGYDYHAGDTLSSCLAPNTQGKYMIFMELFSKENNYLKQYVNTILNCACLSPSLIVGFQNVHSDFDFHKKVDRLVFAIHYITVSSEGP